ncbi:nose resistant to fluoxetine protein 6-like [Dermatophagoides pteronyssinus]|uniref:nose resistant to fluoxetine protein 6-like n=1 Tax=Dermatophagoides pteronyssinus TaxID=6956 RepID=UPI003F67AAB8
MIRKLVIIFLITQLDWIDCNQNESRNHNNNDDYHPIDMIKLWQQHNSQILNIYQIIISSNSVPEDNLCYQSIKHLVMDARKHEQYALKMIDSAGRLSSGLLEGRFTDLGQFKECIKSTGQAFSGRYCHAFITIPEDLISLLSNISGFDPEMYQMVTAKIGICLPSTCQQDDIDSIVHRFSKMFVPELEIRVSNCLDSHDNNKDNPFGLGIFFATFFVILILVVSGTIYDHYNLRLKFVGESYGMITAKLGSQEESEEEVIQTIREPTKEEKILMAFSVKENWKKIFHISGGANSINVFHGMKFLAMLWIIISHSISFSMIWLNFSNPFDMRKKVYNIFQIFMLNGTFSVDIFFFISGYLVMHNLVRYMSADTSSGLNLKAIYLNRYIRMTPTMMFIIFFSTTVLRHLGNGPEWFITTIMYDVWCRSQWYLNLFYLHNFIKTETMCISHSWYSGVDIQFFLITPLIVLLVLRNRWLGLSLIMFILLSSITITAILTFVNGYPPVPLFNDLIDLETINSYYKNIYIKPYTRIGPYMIGVLLAYGLLTNTRDVRLSKKVLSAGWIFAVSSTLGIMVCMLPANNGYLPSKFSGAMYSALSRNIFAIGLAWITFVSITDQGGCIQTFFSLNFWVPLSRLTYCAYLLNPIVIAIFYGNCNQTFEYTPLLMIYFAISNLCVTYLASLLLALFIEYPLMTISKILLSNSMK